MILLEHHTIDRRGALRHVAGGIACVALPVQARAAGGEARHTVPFGSAVQIPWLVDNPEYRAAIVRHCSIVVPEGGLKWLDMRPDPKSYWFGLGDKLVDFGARHDMQVRGHTLVWHGAMPQWAKELGSAAEATHALSDHISKVVGRYAGRIASWDVINEPLPEDQQTPNERRASIWYRLLGEDYIPFALKLANAADPRAELVINEYDLEFVGGRFERKRAGMLDLLEKVRKSGAPLHALGLQAHLRGERDIDRPGLARFIREVHGLGLEIVVTELDVMDYSLPGDVAERDTAVAARAAALLDVVFENCTPRAVLTWGLSDRHVWVPDYFKRPDKLPNRPLPLDENYAAKPFQRVLERFGAKVRN